MQRLDKPGCGIKLLHDSRPGKQNSEIRNGPEYDATEARVEEFPCPVCSQVLSGNSGVPFHLQQQTESQSIDEAHKRLGVLYFVVRVQCEDALEESTPYHDPYDEAAIRR